MPGRVILLHAEDPAPWTSGRFSAALARLPPFMYGGVFRLHRWADRQTRILGRLLLRAGLFRLGLHHAAHLSAWTRDASGRPRIQNCPADFSISHTGALALCALSLGGRVGVDVEPHAPLNLPELRAAFGAGEWTEVLASADPSLALLRLWTAKEAALKADGRGLSIEPSGIDGRGARISIHGVRWSISRPAVGPRWVCSLATNWPAPEIEILNPDIAFLTSEPLPQMVACAPATDVDITSRD